MTEDEDVLARMAALEAELRADPKVQADLKARQAERIRADQASGDVPTILLDDNDPPGADGGAGETREQKRARAIARLKAKRAGEAAGAAAPPADETVEQKRARAIARLKAERAAKNAAAAAPKPQAALATGRPAATKPAKAAAPAPDPFDDLDDDELLADLLPARTTKATAPAKPDKKGKQAKASLDVADALELAGKAAAVKGELTRPKEAGEKSWLTAGLLGLFFGPMGWLYAGAWRESVPAGALYFGAATLATKLLPMFMLMPVLMVVAPVSAIVGVIYAAKFNKAGKRQRVFGENPALPPPERPAGLPAGARTRGKLGPGRR